MKKFIQYTLLTAIMAVPFLSVSAQKSLSEGMLKYEITEVKSDAAEAQMMKGTEISIAFTDAATRLTMQMMGGMIEMDVITETATEKSVVLMNMMGQKSMVKQDEKEEEGEEELKNDFDITYDKSDTKEIAGFNCYKATLVDKKTSEKIDMYVAKKLTMPAVKFANDLFPGLDGLPMELSMNSQGMGMVLTCIKLEESVRGKDVYLVQNSQV